MSDQSKPIAKGDAMTPKGRDNLVKGATREGQREGAEVQRDQGVNPNTPPPANTEVNRG